MNLARQTFDEEWPIPASRKVAGIDIGSRSIELVILSDDGIEHRGKVPTTFDPLGQCRRLLDGHTPHMVVATGYGRRLFAEAFPEIQTTTITEIQAYARGARALFPEIRSILDIGGQDTKAILLTPQGKVARFEMNDRCAAGTGKFLEFMATALQIPLESFGEFALGADRRVQITSMCTVFAETEATSLMARGERPENIAMGLHLAIAQRTVAMLKRVGLESPVLFAGGVAHNPCMRTVIEEQVGAPLWVPEEPDMVGALGAALHGAERH